MNYELKDFPCTFQGGTFSHINIYIKKLKFTAINVWNKQLNFLASSRHYVFIPLYKCLPCHILLGRYGSNIFFPYPLDVTGESPDMHNNITTEPALMSADYLATLGLTNPPPNLSGPGQITVCFISISN